MLCCGRGCCGRQCHWFGGGGGLAGAAGLDRDQVGVEVADADPGLHAGLDLGCVQGAVQQQHPDQGAGACLVAQPRSGGVPEPLRGRGECPQARAVTSGVDPANAPGLRPSTSR